PPIGNGSRPEPRAASSAGRLREARLASCRAAATTNENAAMNKPPTRSSETKTPSLGELMGAMTFTVGFVPPWLSATGWAYAYHYFDRFGVPLMMVDIPREYYFIYGATVVQQFPLWGLAIVMVAIAVLALWPFSNLTYGRIDPPWVGEAL